MRSTEERISERTLENLFPDTLKEHFSGSWELLQQLET